MFNRLRSRLGLRLVAPAGLLPPTGSFELLGTRCIGSVSDPQQPDWLPMRIWVESRHREVLRIIESHRSGHGRRYDFSVDLDDEITSRDLLRDWTRLCAENAFGARSYLPLDGASQLNLIRQHLGKPKHLLFDVDFASGGTAEKYLGQGWAHPEAGFCWTNGYQAKLSIPADILREYRHELTMRCRPLLAPSVQRQDLTVTFNGYPQNASLDGKMLGLITLTYPSGSLADGCSAEIVIDLPDAERPSRLNPDSKDERLLALAFRQMTLARLLDDNDAG